MISNFAFIPQRSNHQRQFAIYLFILLLLYWGYSTVSPFCDIHKSTTIYHSLIHPLHHSPYLGFFVKWGLTICPGWPWTPGLKWSSCLSQVAGTKGACHCTLPHTLINYFLCSTTFKYMWQACITLYICRIVGILHVIVDGYCPFECRVAF
jgi:hypothetical protein